VDGLIICISLAPLKPTYNKPELSKAKADACLVLGIVPVIAPVDGLIICIT
tara:strand:+ start:62 stop:214 length:153 start_codon:yes stop_codon:yes gene_type:complete